MIPTLNDLRKKWGDERYLNALKKVVEMHIKNNLSFIYSVDQLKDLYEKDNDAFELFASRIYYL